MRPDAFTSKERGIVRKDPTGFWAFHPESLPRRLDLSHEIINLLDEATGSVHRLGGVGRLGGGFPLSIRLLREMHEHLLAGVRGRHRRPGELRSSPV